MSTTKHTPVLPEICTECGSVDMHLKTNCGQVVSAQCQDCRYYWPLDTAYPVHLANAAPELLEALKAMVARYGNGIENINRDTKAAQAAIAKAEGR